MLVLLEEGLGVVEGGLCELPFDEVFDQRRSVLNGLSGIRRGHIIESRLPRKRSGGEIPSSLLKRGERQTMRMRR